MRYNGFISYSHAADGKLAPALQKALQRLAKPWYRRRSLEIFRDETGLSVDPTLWGAIVRALDDSEWFLLLTSPRAAQSEWVNREIEHWKANRSADRILPVVTDGHWQWDEKTGEFTEDSDAVPPALRGVFTDEPRHLDMRWAHHEEHLDLHNARFRDAVAEVAAPLHGRSKDEIEGEDVRQHRRTIRIAWSATVALAVLTIAAVISAGFAVNNANRAEQRRIDAEAQRLVAQSQSELQQPGLAFLLAAHGYRLRPNAQTKGALLTSVANMPELKQRIAADAPVTAVATSDAADRVWIGTAEGDVMSRRFSDGHQLARADGVFNRELIALAPAREGADNLVGTDGTVVTTLDSNLKPIMTRTTTNPITSLAVEASTGRIAAGTGSGQILVWATDSAEPTAKFPAGISADLDEQVTALAWTPDGELVAGWMGGFRRIDPATPNDPRWSHQTSWVTALTVLPDGTVVTGQDNGSVGFWDGNDGSPKAGGGDIFHADAVADLAVTGDVPEAGSVVSVSKDGFLIYWNHLSGRPTGPPVRVDAKGADSVAWDPANPNHGVTGGDTGGVWLVAYGTLDRLSSAAPGWTDVAQVAISPARDKLAVVRILPATASGSVDGDPRLVSELMVTEPDRPEPRGPWVRIDGVVQRLAFSPDGSRVLASTTEGTVAVWDGSSGTATLTEVAPRGHSVDQLAVSADGETVATGSVNLDAAEATSSTVRLWRFDGQSLVQTGRVQAPLHAYGLAFSPDASRLVIGGINAMVIQPMDGEAPITVDLADDMTRSLAVSPDGKTVAVGLWSGSVRLLDIKTGEPTGDDLRVTARVTDLAFTDDGAGLITVSEDGTFILWDLASRRRLSDKPLTVVDRSVDSGAPIDPSLAVSTDRALTASYVDGRLLSWPLDPEDWITVGCNVFQRNLTDAEKDRFGLQGAAPICST